MNAVTITARFLLPAIGLCLAWPVAQAQNPPPQADLAIDAAARAEVIDGALKALNDGYVFPDVAARMEQAIRARQQRKDTIRSRARGSWRRC